MKTKEYFKIKIFQRYFIVRNRKGAHIPQMQLLTFSEYKSYSFCFFGLVFTCMVSTRRFLRKNAMNITKEQWKQFQKNIEEATNSCIIVQLKLDEYEEKDQYYINWVDEEEVGLVPVSACLLGTLDELLYNYFGDEQQITLYLDEKENQQYRDTLIQALFENKQVPVRYFVLGTAYEDAKCLEVAILQEPPKNYIVELIYKDGIYEVKHENRF